MKRLLALIGIFLLFGSAFGSVSTAAAAPGAAPAASQPIPADGLVQFTSGGHILGFQAGGVYIVSPAHALHVTFLGANNVPPATAAAPAAPTPPSLGAPGDPRQAPTRAAAQLGAVTWSNLWDGISLTAAAAQGSIFETTYTLAPGAQVERIRLLYNTPAQPNPDGSLSLAVSDGALSESAPLAWQEVAGVRSPVPVSFEVAAIPGGAQVGFSLGAYDPRLAVTIDPRLQWAARMSSGSSPTADYSSALVLDGSGNLYISGSSYTPWTISGVVTKRPFSQSIGAAAEDIYVVKFNSSGAAQWLTFLGGPNDDYHAGLALDGLGNVYVSGTSYETWDTPVQAIHVSPDAFVARLNSDGSLSENTFVGGPDSDIGISLAFANGSLFLGGISQASWGSPVRTFSANGNNPDGFVAQLNPSSLAVVWNSFLGGSSADWLRKIAVDSSGNTVALGFSLGPWHTPKRSYTNVDAFVARLDSTGHLLWNTFLGGNGQDDGWGIALDPVSGSIYVTGFSDQAWTFASMPNPVNAFTGSNEIFVAALTSAGDPIWYTFLGSASGWDDGFGVAVSGGLVFVTGYANASWGSPLHAHSGSYDTFIAALNQSTGVLLWNTFYGGQSMDQGNAIALDASNPANLAVYVAGESSSTWGNPIRAYSGNSDGMLMKLTAASGWTAQWNTFLGGGQDDFANALTLDPASGTIYVAGSANSSWSDYARRKYTWLSDAFVESFDSSGARNWVTYLGGNALDDADSIVFSNNKLYVAGESYGPWGAPKVGFSADADGFVASLDPANGDLMWNTFAGGLGRDAITSLTVSASGQIYAGGFSTADWGGPSASYTSGFDGMLFLLNADGSRMWNTFLGGSGSDAVYDVDIHGSYLYAVGSSSQSWGFPIIDAFHGGSNDAFVVRVDPNTGRYSESGWITFLGGSAGDSAYSVVSNAFAYLYVAGLSSATWGSPRRAYTSGNDAFVAYLSSSGALQWNTFLGGPGNDKAVGVTLDPAGNLFVTGSSEASWGTPLIPFHGGSDIFLSRLTWDGYLLWNVFQGGPGLETATGLAATGNIISATERIYTSSFTDTPWVSGSYGWWKDGYDGVLASLDPRYYLFTPVIGK